jgi:outer membrane beta-barrel protein
MKSEGQGHSAMGMTKKTEGKAARGLWLGLAAGLSVLAFTESVQAQEILLTGPLAGAPAVRKLRLRREGRFEVAPVFSFTLLDEYQRQIFAGARLNYNFTDWLAIGVFGAYGAIKTPTGLSDKIQSVNAGRGCRDGSGNTVSDDLNCRLTATNMGPNFKDQIADLDWMVAPQVTGVPFRGKLALFQAIYVDTDLYFFAGPAFVGIKDRGDCDPASGTDCTTGGSFKPKSRMAIAPTFGLGLTFYVNKWNAIGFEWRALPFEWNTGGFDTAGGGPNNEFPDNKITSADRQFTFNQMLTVSYNFYLPTEYRISE